MTAPGTYLDHNASTTLLPAAAAAIADALALTGNPSSVHAHGRAVRALVDKARDLVAELAGAERREVVFTSSATEALTQAIWGGVRAFAADEVLVSAGEHAAVLKAAEMTGKPVTLLPFDANGVLALDALDSELERLAAENKKALFAVQWVNNETGVIQPVEALETWIGPSPHLLVIDAVQAFAKIGLDFTARASDMMVISAHKIGGPAGVGALLMKAHCDEVRLIPGGGQEMGRRGGTEPWSLIAGFGAAAAAVSDAYDKDEITRLVDKTERGLRKLAPETVIFGEQATRIGNVTNIAVPGLTNAVALMGLDLEGVSISSGAACSSGKVKRSHVLEAMGVSPELADCGLRISFGWDSTEEDVNAFLAAFAKVLGRHHKKPGQAA